MWKGKRQEKPSSFPPPPAQMVFATVPLWIHTTEGLGIYYAIPSTAF